MGIVLHGYYINYRYSFSFLGIFQNSTGTVSDSYYTDITPAGWTFSLWAVIYTWQLLFIGYSLSTICRRTSYGYLYVNPAHQPITIFIIYTFNLLTNIAWLLLWDHFYPQYGLIFLPLTAFSLYICLALSCHKLYHVTPVLRREEQQVDIWLTRIFSQNGLGIYAAWTTIATLLNLDIVLITSGHLLVNVAGTICLSILNAEIVIWFFTDVCLLDRFTRYLYTPYVVFVVALGGSISKNWEATSSNSVLSGFTLALAIALALVKLAVMVYRHLKKPMFGNGSGFYSEKEIYGSMGSGKDYLS